MGALDAAASPTLKTSAIAGEKPAMAESLPELARVLWPLFDRGGPVGDKKGDLAEETVQALHGGGFFGMWTPRGLGGAELPPVESLSMIEEVSRADGSTGWVLMAAALSTGTGAAYLDPDLVRSWFARERFPVIAGQGGPMGRAVACEGGYRVSGHWTYGSGIRHADYLHSGALIFEADGSPRRDAGGAQQTRILVLQREAVAYHENWDVMGLRATGSIDYSSAGVFVPEAATHSTECTEPRSGGRLFWLGIRGLSSLGHTGFTLGLGRRILDEIAAIAQTKVNRLGRLGDSESFLEKYGSVEARLRAARALAYETWQEVENSLDRGDRPSTRQWTMIRLALNHVTWTTAEIANVAYYAGGGTALRAGTLQRCFRDMHGATQHLTSSVAVLQDCARELAGLAPDKVWGFSRLVERH